MTENLRSNTLLVDWASQQLNGPSAIRRDLLTNVQSLDGLSEWTPKSGGLAVLSVLSLGAALDRIDDSSFNPLLSAIATSLIQSDKASPDNLAELYAAALVRPWCDRVTSIRPIDGQRTPDLLATTQAVDVEIEVTIAVKKAEQNQRAEIAAALQSKLRELCVQKHLVVYFLDSLAVDDIDDIMRAAPDLEVNTFAEIESRWHIRARKPNNGIVVAGVETPPTWYPEQLASPVSFQTSIGQEVPAASVEVRWALSTKSYINPLKKKAERIQGSGNTPFLIAVDVSDLPGALNWYEQNLAAYLDIWPDVSGVLVFQRSTILFNALSISYKLLQNPTAKLPLPQEILMRAGSGKWEEQFFVS